MSNGVGEFQSLEDLRDMLDIIGRRLHAKNRIAGGENDFLWMMAEVIRATGRLSAVAYNDPFKAEPIEACHEGTSPNNDLVLDRFLALLREELKHPK